MRFSKLLKIVPFFVSAAVMITACSKDTEEEPQPEDPNKPETVDPTAPTNDPTGTVVMRMRNDNETKLGNMIISSDNNFSCSGTNNMIASIGQVSGLGNITDIPLSGWSDNVAVEIGNGYVYYDGSQYYRIYAVQWLKDALTDAIIGVELKYQSPFKGIDEEIGVENLALSFSGDGGEDDIFFTNTSVIPFTVSCDQDWCYVERCTSNTKDEDFLYDGIHLTVQKNTTKDEGKAKIIIQTLYGKRTVITVTRGGETPSITFPNGETTFERTDIPANGETQTMTLSTNVDTDEIVVNSNSSWITAEIYPYGSTTKSIQKELRSIEGRDVTPRGMGARAASRLTLRYTVAPNYSSDGRQAKISLNSTSGAAIATMNFVQNAGVLTLDEEIAECSSSEQDFNFTFTTNVGGEYSVTSDAAWCTPAYPEYNVSVDNMTTRSTNVRLSVSDNISEKSRTANVTIAAKDGSLKTVLKLTQSPTSFENMPSTLYFDRNASNQQIQLPVKGLRVKSPVDWCSVSVNGTTLTVRVAAATDTNRKTTLTIEGFSGKITVDQSKYAIGDSYDEKGITGIVCHMKGEIRLVRSANLGSTSYSNEDVLIGTSDMDNGLANMAVVKAIAGWQNFYPAFALCDALNVDGITGWYLPAANEATGENGWSSTEYDTQNAYYRYGTSTNIASKDMTKPVYAVHHFVD